MTALVFVTVLTLLIIIAGLLSLLSSRRTAQNDARAQTDADATAHADEPSGTSDNISPDEVSDSDGSDAGGSDADASFEVTFTDGHRAQAMRVMPDADPHNIVEQLGLQSPNATLFVSGGAGLMSEEDVQRTTDIITEGVVEFAERYQVTVVDGGTESGVMKMIGDARHSRGYTFPLVGVAPHGLVSYQGFDNPNEQAMLEDGHSHFVLVDGDEWGDESQMIVDLTRAIAKTAPKLGMLINGGKIAEHDVYLATAKADAHERIPMLILEGSGRAADNISSAFRTGETQSAIIRAIVTGGDIRLVSIHEGAQAIFKQLEQHLVQATSS